MNWQVNVRKIARVECINFHPYWNLAENNCFPKHMLIQNCYWCEVFEHAVRVKKQETEHCKLTENAIDLRVKFPQYDMKGFHLKIPNVPKYPRQNTQSQNTQCPKIPKVKIPNVPKYPRLKYPMSQNTQGKIPRAKIPNVPKYPRSKYPTSQNTQG